MRFFSPRISIALLLVAAACGGNGTPTEPAKTGPSAPTGPSALATAYLNELLDKMQANSIKRRTINWTDFRATVLAAGATAQTIGDTRSAIQTALTMLADGHSSYTTATGIFVYVPNRTCIPSGATTPALPSNIGYIRVGAFSGTSAQALAFAEGIQGGIASRDHADLIGWVVDLRGNGGGNMWPMIAGLGPIIGDGPIGYFIDPFGATSLWEYHDGASWSGGFAVTTVANPYRLRRERPRVAVLTDQGIASSGEATLIAFRGRPDTRSFGTATCGLSTANRGFPMSDGALLNLTTSTMADRFKNQFGDVILPDEVVSTQADGVAKAIAWLQTGGIAR